MALELREAGGDKFVPASLLAIRSASNDLPVDQVVYDDEFLLQKFLKVWFAHVLLLN